MSSPSVRTLNVDGLQSAIFDYDIVGCTLAKHEHTEADAHTIIVQRGVVRLRVWNPDGSVTESVHDASADTGYYIDTKPGFPHELAAMSDGARTIHHPKKQV